MYTTQYPNEYLDYCMRPGREWQIIIPGIDSDDLTNFTFESVLGDRSLFTIGTTSSSKITVELRRPNGGESAFKGTTLSPKLSLKTFVIIDGELVEVWQEVPLGKFIVNNVSRLNDYIISLEAYDRMSSDKSAHKKYSYTGTFPVSCSTIVNDIARKLGCNVVTSTIPYATLSFEKKIIDRPIRDVLAYIAALSGGFCRFNREGDIEFFKQFDTEIIHGPENGMREIIEKDYTFTIGGFKCQVGGGDNFITAGEPNDNESTIELINYDMTQENLNTIFEEYKQKTFWSLIVDGMLNPALDCGDIIHIKNLDGQIKTIQIQSYHYAIKGGPQGKYECEYDLEDMEWDDVDKEEEKEPEEEPEEERPEELDDINKKLEELENKEDPNLTPIYEELRDLESIGCNVDLDPIYNKLKELEDRVTALERRLRDYNEDINNKYLAGLEDMTVPLGTPIVFTMNIEGDYLITHGLIISHTVIGKEIHINTRIIGTTVLTVKLNYKGKELSDSCKITVVPKEIYIPPSQPIVADFALLDSGDINYASPQQINSLSEYCTIDYPTQKLSLNNGLLLSKIPYEIFQPNGSTLHYYKNHIWLPLTDQQIYDKKVYHLSALKYDNLEYFKGMVYGLKFYSIDSVSFGSTVTLDLEVDLRYEINVPEGPFVSRNLSFFLVVGWRKGTGNWDAVILNPANGLDTSRYTHINCNQVMVSNSGLSGKRMRFLLEFQVGDVENGDYSAHDYYVYGLIGSIGNGGGRSSDGRTDGTSALDRMPWNSERPMHYSGAMYGYSEINAIVYTPKFNTVDERVTVGHDEYTPNGKLFTGEYDWKNDFTLESNYSQSYGYNSGEFMWSGQNYWPDEYDRQIYSYDADTTYLRFSNGHGYGEVSYTIPAKLLGDNTYKKHFWGPFNYTFHDTYIGNDISGTERLLRKCNGFTNKFKGLVHSHMLEINYENADLFITKLTIEVDIDYNVNVSHPAFLSGELYAGLIVHWEYWDPESNYQIAVKNSMYNEDANYQDKIIIQYPTVVHYDEFSRQHLIFEVYLQSPQNSTNFTGNYKIGLMLGVDGDYLTKVKNYNNQILEEFDLDDVEVNIDINNLTFNYKRQDFSIY